MTMANNTERTLRWETYKSNLFFRTKSRYRNKNQSPFERISFGINVLIGYAEEILRRSFQ
jgi:hypothetical protein